jgi:hypothetical protein
VPLSGVHFLPMSYDKSTQLSRWLFGEDEKDLHEVLRAANAWGRASVRAGKVPEKVRCFASRRSKRSLESQDETDAELGPPPENDAAADGCVLGDEDLLTCEEEDVIKRLNMAKVLKMCGTDAEDYKHLRRSDRVIADAWAFFQRFFLSNSVMEYDPFVVAMSAVFLAGKIEDEMILIQDLAEATNFDESAILGMEPHLLEAIGFNLRVFAPYKPLLAFLNQLEQHPSPSGDKIASKTLLALHEKATAIIDAILYTNMPFIYSPAQLALAALLRAAEGNGSEPPPFDADSFLESWFGKEAGFHELKAKVARIRERIAADPQTCAPPKVDRNQAIKTLLKRNKEHIKQADKKLRACALWSADRITKKRRRAPSDAR